MPITGEWSKFFEDAGFPSTICLDYANIFVKNRMKFEHLHQLEGTHLKLMGIDKVGDIITITDFAKDFKVDFIQNFLSIG